MKKIMKDYNLWLDMCWLYFMFTILSLLGIRWYTSLISTIICGIFSFVLIRRSRVDTYTISIKKIKRAMKKAKKRKDSIAIYEVFCNECLEEVRKTIPRYIYKYYSLDNNSKLNEQKLSSLRNNSIWSSQLSGFNDPFEGQYLYLSQKDFKEIGIPIEAKKLWDDVIGEIKRRITSICFTQNPDDMPMWAHYSNNHKGFCVKYEVKDVRHLYPVLYIEKRQKADVFFFDLFYELWLEEQNNSKITTIVKYYLFLCSFKHKSWESEKEIRALFLNFSKEIHSGGKSYPCKTIGIEAKKIYIGARCDDSIEKELEKIAKELDIEFEKCNAVEDEEFNILA